jgi:hypothetical protein
MGCVHYAWTWCGPTFVDGAASVRLALPLVRESSPGLFSRPAHCHLIRLVVAVLRLERDLGGAIFAAGDVSGGWRRFRTSEHSVGRGVKVVVLRFALADGLVVAVAASLACLGEDAVRAAELAGEIIGESFVEVVCAKGGALELVRAIVDVTVLAALLKGLG